MTFVPVVFVDASQATAAYVKQFKTRLSVSLDGEVDAINLWSGGQAAPILGEWKSAKVLLTKVRNAVAPFLGGKPAVLERAYIVSLGVGKWWSWKMPEPGGPWAILGLLPSPGAMVYSGISGANPPVGQLTLLSRDAPFSGLNLGPVPAVWLVCEARMPDAPEVRVGEP